MLQIVLLLRSWRLKRLEFLNLIGPKADKIEEFIIYFPAKNVLFRALF